MKDSKLIELLSCFTLKELKRLKVMADSAYFNTEEPIRCLLDFLLKYAPNFDHPKMTHSHAFSHIYGKRTVQSDPKTAVEKVMSKLVSLIKEFIVQLEIDAKPIERSLLQTHFFTEKKMLDFVPRILDDAEKMLEASDFRNEPYFRYKLLLAFERSAFLNIIQDKSNPDYQLNHQNRALDCYYAISKLQTYCFAKNEASRVNFEFDYSQMERFLDWLDLTGLLEDFNIETWHLALRLLNAPHQPLHFYALKRNIHLHKNELDPAVIRVLYSYLANTAPFLYPDREIYFKELFDLYKEQIELGILYVGGYLSPIMLRNITIVGIKRHEFVWVEDFLKNNAHKIVPTYLEREDIVVLCKAYLYFGKGAFHCCLDMINILKYDNIFTKMDERRLRLMCYYEMGIRNPFDDLINSFRKFLTDHKKKIPYSYFEGNRLFIQYLHEIATGNLKSRTELRALATAIQQTTILPEKEWLLAKIQI